MQILIAVPKNFKTLYVSERKTQKIQAIDLNELYDQLNDRWWKGKLAKVPSRWSTRMHAIAGKFWSSKQGPEIVLSVKYHSYFPGQIEDTLKHEMVHVYIHQHGLRKYGQMHGRAFIEEAKRVGAPIHCSIYPEIRKPFKYEWACPNCGRTSKSRVKRTWACKPCCVEHNRGRYSERYQLQIVRTL